MPAGTEVGSTKVQNYIDSQPESCKEVFTHFQFQEGLVLFRIVSYQNAMQYCIKSSIARTSIKVAQLSLGKG